MPTITAQSPLPTTPTKSAVEGTPEPKQIDKVEASPPEATIDTEKKEPSLTPQHVALARKEKAIREQMRAIQAEREAVKAEKAEVESLKAWKAKLSQDPLSVMTEAGISYDQLTQSLLNAPNGGDPTIMELKRELQSIKDAQAQAQTQIQTHQQQQYEQAKKQIKNEVTVLCDGDETFETIKTMGAQDAVVELIEEHFKDNGVLLSIEEAAKEVEEYLLTEALKYAQIKKVQSRLAPKPAEPTQVPEKTTQTQKTPSPTLSNRMTPSSSKPMTARERRERAIAAFMGQKIQ